MRKAAFAGAVVALTLLIAAANTAAAMSVTPSLGPAYAAAKHHGAAQIIHFARQRAEQWAPREYWQWDNRPIWDHPWEVLRPNFWGSPEPYLVPADVWVRKWHLPRVRSRKR
ncbi:MAG: hypothetical protein ACREH9_07945 [Pseudomonadota bacterium]